MEEQRDSVGITVPLRVGRKKEKRKMERYKCSLVEWLSFVN